MLYYLVIGICIALLFATIYFSIKPISMGIEARRNLNNKVLKSDDEISENIENSQNSEEKKLKISDEIVRLNDLRKEGVLTEEEFERAKKKLLN